jgi:Leucine-rich repeat (LRR) protein
MNENRLTALRAGLLSNLPAVKKITLNNNLLTIVEVGAFAGSPVTDLDLSDNRITRLNPFTFPAELLLLYVRMMILHYPDTAFLSYLVFSRLNRNPLGCPSPQFWKRFTSTSLNGIEISETFDATRCADWSTFLSLLPDLQRLFISFNEISLLTDEMFRGLPNLLHLDLNGNLITLLPPRMITYLPHLERVGHVCNNDMESS